MLGPNGLNKMLYEPSGNIEVTQKGFKVVKFLKNKAPIILLLKTLVEAQEENCGDGTKSVLLITGFLLDKAKQLLDDGIPAQVIIEGISLASRKVLGILEKLSITTEKDPEF